MNRISTSVEFDAVDTRSDAVISSDSRLNGDFTAPFLSAERSLVAAIGYALDCMPYGVILVDAGSRLLFINASARAIVADSGALSLRDDRVTAANPCETAALRQSIAAAAKSEDGGDRPAPRTIFLTRAHPLPPLPVITTPLGGRSDAAAAAIFVGDAERGEESADHVLMRLYGLTAAEARLSFGLLEGKGLTWAARQNAISLNTARTHLRHGFEKTRTHRQAELVRLILRSPAMLRFDWPRAQRPAWNP